MVVFKKPTMRPEGDVPVYVISVAARLTGLPAWMLRLLDQEGIVIPTRTEKNRRLYSDNDLARLERVRYLTEVKSVNMAGVRLILEMEEQAVANASASLGDAGARTSEKREEVLDSLAR